MPKRNLVFVAVLAIAAFATGMWTSPARAALADFEGVWRNTDAGTRGVTRLTIRAVGDGLEIQAFGRCRPEDCDWGTQQAVAYAASPGDDLTRQARTLSVRFRSGDINKTLIIRQQRNGNGLRVDVLTRFKPWAGRSNHHAGYSFERAPTTGGTLGDNSGSYRAGGPAPDLAIRGFQYRATGECAARQPVYEIRVTVENRGDAPSPAITDRAMVQVLDQHPGKWGNGVWVGALAPGARETVVVPIYYYLNRPGHMTRQATHPFQVTLDPLGLLDEKDESNNTSKAFNIPAPVGCG